MSPTKKPPYVLPLHDLEERADAMEVERFAAMSPDELDAHLRASGEDPAALRDEGAAFVEGLMNKRERLAWQVAAAEGLAREQGRVDKTRGMYADVPRTELLARIDRARRDPRLAQPVAVMFRNQGPDEATDDELRAMLEEIEALAGREG